MRDEKRLLGRWVGPKEREEEELGGVRGTRGRLVEVGAVDGRSLSQTVTQNGSLGWRCSRTLRQPRKQVSSPDRDRLHDNLASEASPVQSRFRVIYNMSVCWYVCWFVYKKYICQNVWAEIRGPNTRMLKVCFGRLKPICDTLSIHSTIR